MNIIFLRSGYGSPDSRLEKELRTLIESGHNVKVLAWDRESKTDKINYIKNGNFSIEYYHIGIISELAAGFKKNLLPMIRFNFKIFSYLKKHINEFDCIHASDFDTVLPAYFIKKIYNKKIVYDIYDYYADSHKMPALINSVIRSVDTRIINKADYTVVCSEERVTQIYPAKPANIVVIHNSPEKSMITDNYKENSERTKIVYVGGLIESGRYIKELIDFVKITPQFELHIGGYGSFERYVKEQASINDNIIFYGKLDYKDVIELEQQCDIMTALYDPSLPNHKYAAPNKFYEALMLGKPLICIKGTGIDLIVKSNKIGWVIDIENNSFGSAMELISKEIISGETDLEGIHYKMMDLYNKDYNWDIMKVRLSEMYNKINSSLKNGD